jgi:DNA modification methylase
VLHTSYSFPLAFEANLVGDLLDTLKLAPRSTILDPFCGTGTTVLESKIRGYRSVGVDANPVCVMVSRAKTDWGIDVAQLKKRTAEIVQTASAQYARYLARFQAAKGKGKRYAAQSDPLFSTSHIGGYLVESGLLHRGWISPRPALKALLLAEEIRNAPSHLQDFLFLCFLGLLVPEFSNMAYGPEIYRKRKRHDSDVFGLFESRTKETLAKMEELRKSHHDAGSRVRFGDSVNGGLSFLPRGSIDAVITSPPYLSDHDYSRLTRLELVFTETVTSKDDLRAMKKFLLRSSSKNVYKGDSLAAEAIRFRAVKDAVAAVAERAESRSSGFARVYPRLVGEYFGGMYQHFRRIGRVLRAGGHAAYIVGDQSSFFATPIPTARILAQLAEECGAGLELIDMLPVRKLRGTRGQVTWSNSEWLILLHKS